MLKKKLKKEIAKATLVEAVPLPHEPGKPISKCFVPPESFDKLHQDLLQVSVYNDCYLYQKDASINITYQRWFIKWLTERWHNKFDINNRWNMQLKVKMRNL